MAANNQIQTALLTEHFRYTPLTLLDDIINTVNELVFRAVNAIEEGLNQTPPEALGFTLSPTQQQQSLAPDDRQNALFDLKRTEIDTGIVQLESLLNATVDKDFDKFELYALRNILAVGHDEREAGDLAPWVRLAHYRDLPLDGDVGGVPQPEEVQLQRRKLQETVKLNAMLKAEEARNEAVLGRLRGVMREDGAPFAFLTASNHLSTQSDSQPLTQKVQYALSQLPALRQLLSQLRSSLPHIPNATRQARGDQDGAEAKRREYLDSQSRRAVRRRDVEVPDEGPRKTQASLGGRRIGRDEVEGMEAVVRALRGGGANG